MSQLSPEEMPRADGMPMLGLGTWQNDDPEQCAESVRTALEMGYRHIDTAEAYGNEDAVGEGLARADVPREDVFLATKVWISSLAHDDVLSAAERSLDRLGVDSVDLLYVHWAAGEYDPADTIPAFNELHDEGNIERFGVSNFEPHHVETAREHAAMPVFANQVELHPLLPRPELREFAAETDLQLVAYSPLARGRIFENDTITEIADAHDVSPAQVSLAWLREKGVTAIPKATGEDHLGDNLASLDLDLSGEDVAAIDDIGLTERQIDPDFAPDAW
jgi:diketogulonate reductase-like aldo/keto reductase